MKFTDTEWNAIAEKLTHIEALLEKLEETENRE